MLGQGGARTEPCMLHTPEPQFVVASPSMSHPSPAVTCVESKQQQYCSHLYDGSLGQEGKQGTGTCRLTSPGCCLALFPSVLNLRDARDTKEGEIPPALEDRDSWSWMSVLVETMTRICLGKKGMCQAFICRPSGMGVMAETQT